MAETEKRGHLRYKLNQYVFLLLLKDILNIYSSIEIAINTLLNMIATITIDEIEVIKNMVR